MPTIPPRGREPQNFGTQYKTRHSDSGKMLADESCQAKPRVLVVGLLSPRIYGHGLSVQLLQALLLYVTRDNTDTVSCRWGCLESKVWTGRPNFCH